MEKLNLIETELQDFEIYINDYININLKLIKQENNFWEIFYKIQRDTLDSLDSASRGKWTRIKTIFITSKQIKSIVCVELNYNSNKTDILVKFENGDLFKIIDWLKYSLWTDLQLNVNNKKDYKVGDLYEFEFTKWKYSCSSIDENYRGWFSVNFKKQ